MRESAARPVWSQGGELARRRTVSRVGESAGELELRVSVPGLVVAHTVFLRPDAATWECSCDSRDDPCVHVVACAVALRNGWLSAPEASLGYRRVLVNSEHPGAAELLVGGADGTSVGWIGQVCSMWAEFLMAIHEGRGAHADFEDGVRDGAVIDALYASAETGQRTRVGYPIAGERSATPSAVTA